MTIQTNNVNFIKMSKELGKLGVKKPGFILELKDETLWNIDPWSNKLSLEEKLKIFMECLKNPWYFFREVVKVRTYKGLSSISLNYTNLAQYFTCINDLNTIITGSRQIGRTIAEDANTLYEFLFGDKMIYYLDTNISSSIFNGLFDRLDIPKYMINMNSVIESYMTVNNKRVCKINNNSVNGTELVDIYDLDLFEGIKQMRNNALILSDDSSYNTNYFKFGKAEKSRLFDVSDKDIKYTQRAITPTVLLDSYSSDIAEYAFNDINKSIRFGIDMLNMSKDDLKLYESDTIVIDYNLAELGFSKETFKEMCLAMNLAVKTIEREIFGLWYHKFDTMDEIYNEFENMQNNKRL